MSRTVARKPVRERSTLPTSSVRGGCGCLVHILQETIVHVVPLLRHQILTLQPDSSKGCPKEITIVINFCQLTSMFCPYVFNGCLPSAVVVCQHTNNPGLCAINHGQGTKAKKDHSVFLIMLWHFFLLANCSSLPPIPTARGICMFVIFVYYAPWQPHLLSCGAVCCKQAQLYVFSVPCVRPEA